MILPGKQSLIILIILVERAKPLGISPSQSSSYHPVVGWFGPATWPLGPSELRHHVGWLCRIGNDHPRLDFSAAFFSHSNATNKQEFSYITLTTLFSIFRHIIELPGLLSYRDIIPFVQWQNFNAELSSFWLSFIIVNVCCSDLDHTTDSCIIILSLSNPCILIACHQL